MFWGAWCLNLYPGGWLLYPRLGGSSVLQWADSSKSRQRPIWPWVLPSAFMSLLTSLGWTCPLYTVLSSTSLTGESHGNYEKAPVTSISESPPLLSPPLLPAPLHLEVWFLPHCLVAGFFLSARLMSDPIQSTCWCRPYLQALIPSLESILLHPHPANALRTQKWASPRLKLTLDPEF